MVGLISRFMCGIVGYIGKGNAVPVLLEGLSRLEYRGYDSAGVALIGRESGKIEISKSVGRVAELARILRAEPVVGNVGISHTRWATHGAVTRENAHPHTDQSGKLVLVHNGVIENYQQLKKELEEEGHAFLSQTDSEVLAHWIGRELNGSEVNRHTLLNAIRRSLDRVQGTYGIVVMHQELPDVLIGARRGSPLILGIKDKEHYLASDVSAISSYTREVVYLKDYEIAVVEAGQFELFHQNGLEARFEISQVEPAMAQVELGDFPHYMLKEIYEQPESLRNALRGRLSPQEATAKLGGLNMSNAELRAVERLVLSGCGSAMHAAMVGEYLIESLSRIPVECEYASELRYRNLPMTRDSLVFVLSQSGETADTLGALREAQRKGHRTLGICNNVASTIARESDGGVYMHAGQEIGVAATKSFSSQMLVLTLIGLLLGRMRYLSFSEGKAVIEALEQLPEKVREALLLDQRVKQIARKYASCDNMLFMGRQAHFPIALEAALKVKEVSYIHAAGYPSAELKHGVIALVSPETPSFFIAPDDALLEKNISNMEEVKARGGPVIAIGTEGCEALQEVADEVIYFPRTPEVVSPFLSLIPLQFLAYHLAVARGCDVDKPRNLAKSVTVE